MRVQNVLATSLGAAGTGAALMFFLDPAARKPAAFPCGQ